MPGRNIIAIFSIPSIDRLAAAASAGALAEDDLASATLEAAAAPSSRRGRERVELSALDMDLSDYLLLSLSGS